MAKKTLTVPDISCEHCETAITEALTPLPGVRSVKVDIPAHLVELDFDELALTIDKVKEVLEEEAYPVSSVS